MKRPFFLKACKSALACATVLSAAAVVACSDDSSSESQNGTQAPPDSIPVPGQPSPNDPFYPVNSSTSVTDPIVTPVIPGVDGDSAVIPPGEGGGIDTIVVVPEEPDISDIPITDADRVDDGAGSVSSQPFSVSGFAAMGPFAAGTPVSIAPVDVATMIAGSAATSASVKDKKGGYSASGNLSSAIASIEVSGKILDFTMDESAGPVSLKALVDFRNKTTANVNVLTRLEYDRVQNLVTTQGLSFTAAKARAEKEVLSALGFKSDSTLFEDIDLYSASESSAKLLAVTTAFLTDRPADQASVLLEAVAADIGIDGKWDDEPSKASLGDIAYFMDIGYPRSVLSDVMDGDDVEYFKGNVDQFWATMYGLGTCGPNNQKQVKLNGNSASRYASKSFVCMDSLWSEATDLYLNDIAATQLFGACNSSNNGAMKANAEGQYFKCKNNTWFAASESDMLGLAVSAQSGECNDANKGAIAQYQSAYYICVSASWTKLDRKPVDYSKGRAMNKKLGRGMNFGNSWDSPGSDDGAWSNRIGDGDFAVVKAAGFNSVRLPVRWYTGMSSKLSGVKEDVQLAINAGLTVIVNSHHNQPIYDAAKNGSLSSKLNDFKSEWKQIAQTFDSFPDDAVVFEIFNEPHDMTQDQVNQIMAAGYEAIRSVSKGKTIMFESNGYAKFAMIPKLDLPEDGNIIVTGHYYEPYTFTHQGHGYECNGNAGDGVGAMAGQFSSYYEAIALAYPDINGGTVPINMGEFGVANKGSCGNISDTRREAWTDAVLAQAEKYGMSWHYWCYKNCGGFEASNGGSWHGNMLNVFKKYMK